MSKKAGLTLVSNNEHSVFREFMICYWNQMGPDIYSDFGAALSDFRTLEGIKRFQSLRRDFLILEAEGKFPSVADIESAYSDPFWKRFDMIVTSEDLATCTEFLKPEIDKK